eukprot:TRINITY_DN35389_c0_g1_i1.p1 TRINITY_DN35389_c0_g1~~TRINITY_DN35389_c0_g1_i1.p1  ORF type:complete len:449 (+),score=60.23 TRINITY_DN35389_c0_g1_i1:76-1422(+)
MQPKSDFLGTDQMAQGGDIDLDCLLAAIQAKVTAEKKPVSYKWLSLKFGLPVNSCKQILYHFYKANEDKVKASYFVSGWLKDANDNDQLGIRVVSQENLDKTKKQMNKLLSVHIYSVSPSSPADLNSVGIDDWQLVRELHTKMMLGETPPGENPLEKKFGSQVVCEGVKRTENQPLKVQLPKQGDMIKTEKVSVERKVPAQKAVSDMFARADKISKNAKNIEKLPQPSITTVKDSKSVTMADQNQQTIVKQHQNQSNISKVTSQAAQLTERAVEKQQEQIIEKEIVNQSDIFDSDLEEDEDEHKQNHVNVIQSDNEEESCKMDVDQKQNVLSFAKRGTQNTLNNPKTKKRKVQKVFFNSKGEEVTETVEEDVPESDMVVNNGCNVDVNKSINQHAKEFSKTTINQSGLDSSKNFASKLQQSTGTKRNESKGKKQTSKQQNIKAFFKKQ